MKTEPSITQQIAQMAQVSSLLGGGISLTEEHLTETEEGYRYEMFVPGLSPEAYRIRIKDQRLYISTQFAADLPTAGGLDTEAAIAPAVVRTYPIPDFVDAQRIEARFANGRLHIFAPFNGHSPRPDREVDIQLY
ncbi:MAG: Hsp20/alpha crystallin family protein [Bernardetiaceae bacterium]|jgi:HSP20 family molecular chaperone IbpA|nr:Hsp20/alpha crystallin family protein [Bernardetiaceae bacterium]